MKNLWLVLICGFVMVGTAQTTPTAIAPTITAEQRQRLAQELEIPETTLKRFISMLEQQQIPLADIENIIRILAKHYHTLSAQFQTFTANDATVAALKHKARSALEEGDLAHVERLLHEAKAQDHTAIKQMQDALDTRLRSAAATQTELKILQAMQRASADVAEHHRRAAELAPAGGWVPPDPSLADALTVTHHAGSSPETEQSLQQAVALAEQLLGPDHPNVARRLNSLALLYHTQGQYAQAMPLYERALAIRKRALGPEHPDVATSLNNLAALHHVRSQHAQAIQLYKRALAMREKVLGPEHPDVAMSLNNLGLAYQARGQHDEAAPLYQLALTLREQVFGTEHPQVAVSLDSLARLYQSQGRYGQAALFYERAAAMREKTLGSEHPHVAMSLNNVAQLYYILGWDEEAKGFYERALAIQEKTLGPNHPAVAMSLNNLALLYRAQGQAGPAERLFKRALTISEKAFGPKHPSLVPILENYAAILRAANRAAEAQAFEARAQASRSPRGWLGIYFHTFDDGYGIRVRSVVPGSPAAQAGILPGDVIVFFNGQPAARNTTFRRMIAHVAPGTMIDIEVIRQGAKLTLPLTMGTRKVEDGR